MNTTTPETYFAPAGRADEAVLYAERDAIVSSPLLKPIIDAMPDFVVILNEQRQIVGINKRLMQVFGVTHADQLLGKRPGEALNCIHFKEGPDGCGTAESCSVCGAVLTILASQSSHETASGECRMTLQNNGLTSLDLEVMASPLDIAGTHFTIFALKDISSDKRRNVLERVFFHDVLNTAGGIRGVASLIVEGALPEEEEEYKRWMVALSDNLIDDINHQRRLLAAERGEYEPVLEATDIHELLDDVRRLYENHVKTPGRTVVLGTVEHCVVTTDRALLRRIVGNMALNALEASPKNSVVTIETIQIGRGLIIEVTNPGEMPESVQLQVFKRSFSTKGTDGRGIGTYSMKLFGEKYLQGEVGFSCRNGNTSFYIIIPM